MAPTTYAEVLASNIGSLRKRAGMSQESLAERMYNLGFRSWQRQTVGSTERRKEPRRPTAEEILGLALALETTVRRLMTPLAEDKWVELPSGQSLNVEAVVHLVEGRNDGVLRWHGDIPYRTGPAADALDFEIAWTEDEDWAGGIPPVVAAVVTSREGVLIARRNDGKPPWTFIAGEQEPGEMPADTAVREVKEETGCGVKPRRLIGRRVHPQTERTMIYLGCVPAEGTEVHVGDEAELAEVRWASLAEAEQLLPGMFEPVRNYLERQLGRPKK